MLSVYLDLFNVLSNNFNRCITEPNQRYIKTNYLLNNKSKTSRSLILGSSRVGRMKVPDNGKWYNMTSSEALVSENIKDLKLFYNNGMKIDTILLGVDEIPLYVDESTHEGQFMRMGINDFNILEYLLNTFSGELLEKKVLNDLNILDSEIAFYDLKTGNVRLPKRVDLDIEKDPKNHESELLKKGPYWNARIYSFRIEEFKKEILEMKSITLLNNTQLIIFINPLWKKTFERIPENEWNEFIDFMNDNFEYYNFNDYKEITSNPSNYHDNSHYNYKVGKFIFNTLTNNLVDEF